MTTIELAQRCDKDPAAASLDVSRHKPEYHDGKIVFIANDQTETQSSCQHCGRLIRRAHRKSSWWYAR